MDITVPVFTGSVLLSAIHYDSRQCACLEKFFDNIQIYKKYMHRRFSNLVMTREENFPSWKIYIMAIPPQNMYDTIHVIVIGLVYRLIGTIKGKYIQYMHSLHSDYQTYIPGIQEYQDGTRFFKLPCTLRDSHVIQLRPTCVADTVS
jgi:hypothetical protein